MRGCTELMEGECLHETDYQGRDGSLESDGRCEIVGGGIWSVLKSDDYQGRDGPLKSDGRCKVVDRL